MTRTLVSPEGQSATFVELFFDLVFVFGVTQLVVLLHHDLTWSGAGRTILVFWMVWWAWTQFTWALNIADTTHPLVELGTLIATAVAFFMAIAVPSAFEEAGALWFAIPYVLVRVIGLTMYAWVAPSHEGMRRAVRSFTALSIGGLATALLGAYLGGAEQVYLWGMTIFLDLVAALMAGDQESWTIHPEHFSERHGLIVIIALGESLIVAAAALVGVTEFSWTVLGVGVLSVLISCTLWWTYFPIVKAALVAAQGDLRGRIARDSFTLGHFPMLCGVIAYAVGLEEALAHPFDPLPDSGRLAIALGLLLFVGGTALAMWRATCGRPPSRVVIAAIAAVALYFAEPVGPLWTLLIAFGGAAVIALKEERAAERMRARA